MNFSIFFILGLCVLTANTAPTALNSYPALNSVSQRSSIVDSIIQYVNELLERAQQSIEEAASRLNDLIDRVTQQLENAVAQASENLQNILTRIEEELEKLVQQSEAATKCAQQAATDLESLANGTAQAVQNSSQKAAQRTQTLQDNLQKNIQEAANDAQALIDSLAQCLNVTNIFEQISCVSGKVPQVTDSIRGIVGTVLQAVGDATQEAQQISAEVRAEISVIFTAAADNARNILAAAVDCASQSS